MKPCNDTPCAACPMRRKSAAGYLGNDNPDHFIQVVHTDAPMPCHLTVDYERPDWDDQLLPGSLGSATECAGVAIYRRNVGKKPRPFSLDGFTFDPPRELAPDTATVFASPREFLAHHKEEVPWAPDAPERSSTSPSPTKSASRTQRAKRSTKRR